MPLAAHIPVLPALALPAMPASGAAPGKAAPSSREFGELFHEQVREQVREQTGPVGIPALKPESAPEESVDDSAPPPPGIKAVQEPEETSSFSAPFPDSAPAQAQAGSRSQLQVAANDGAVISVVAIERTEAASSAFARESASESPIAAKDGNSAPSPAARPKEKSNQENLASKQSSQKIEQTGASAYLAPSAIPFAVPLAMPPLAAKPETGTPAARQAVADSGIGRWISASNIQNPIQENAAPAQGAPGEDHSAPAPQTQGLQAAIKDQAAPSSLPAALKGADQASASVSADGVASSGKSSEAPSPAPHSSLVAHATLAAEQGTGGAAVASAVALTGPHPAEPGASAPAMPQVAQPFGVATVSPSATTPATAAPNLYDRIDQGAVPVVLHSGAQQVAVGVRDPDLGWVEIKTQNVAGHVDATLVAASGQARASLAAQLPSMAQYLEQREVRVGALAVHHDMPGANPGGSTGGGNGYGAGNGPGNGGNQSPSQSRSGNAGNESGASRYASDTPGFFPAASVVDGENPALRSMSYISVRV